MHQFKTHPNRHLTIEVVKAAHKYNILKEDGSILAVLDFQDGPISESGVNGLMNEELLAIIVDRLEHFQEGEFRCRENALAITKIEEAMHWLRHRTEGRKARGVEGTRTP
jgi:hypothetical protein